MAVAGAVVPKRDDVVRRQSAPTVYHAAVGRRTDG